MNRDEVLSIVRQFTGHENIIAVPRILIELTGDPVMAMMLNQLLYWSEQKEWVYKSLEDWNEEIGGISRHRMEKFAELPYVETELRKAEGAPTTHYRINPEAFNNALVELINAKSIYRKPQMDLPKTVNPFTENRKSLTEITSEITPEIITATTTAADSEIGTNSEVAEVFKAYESEIGLLTNYVREDVLDAIKQYPKEWIVESIKEAAKNNTRKWSYALAILKSWQVNGYKTDIRQKRIDGPKAYQNTRKAKQEDSEDKLNQFRKLYQEQKQNV